MNRAEALDRLWAVLFPKRCVLCDTVVEYDVPHCGCPLRQAEEPVLFFPDFFSVSAFYYEGMLRDAMLRYKETREPRTARFFAGEAAKAWGSHAGGRTVDVAVAVPVKDMALASGPDHAGLLARELSRMLDFPCCETALRRRDVSMPQHSLDRKAREVNAKRSYYAVEPSPLAGKSVLLVDDILTTGATLSACAGALLRAGAREVAALTVARTK